MLRYSFSKRNSLCYSLKMDNTVKVFMGRHLLRILPVYAIGGDLLIVEDIIILKGSFINVVYDFSFASLLVR